MWLVYISLDLYPRVLNVGLTEGAKVLMKTLKVHIGLKIAQVHHLIRILCPQWISEKLGQ